MKLDRVVLIAMILSVSSASADVIFSRRVYRDAGTSYQQIWTWNPVNGALKQLTRSARDHFWPRCEDGQITFISPLEDQRQWKLNPSTGEERAIGPAPEFSDRSSATAKCQQSARFGTLEACGNDETVRISDSGKEIGHFQIETDTCDIIDRGTIGIGKCTTPVFTLAWSYDGKWLLVGEQGLNDGSGERQEDYYLIRLATMKLSTVVSAETAFWLPGLDRLVYLTPNGLAPLFGSRRHNVDVQQLMSFDPETGKAAAITTGLSDNIHPALCNLP